MTAAGDENIEFTNSASPDRRIILPAKLSKIKTAEKFPSEKFKWNTNEEVFSFLISLDKHNEWFCKQVQKRPQNGSMFLYNRKNKKTKDYRKDDFLWKTRKNYFNTTREDHTKLKVEGVECLYGSYAHSSLVPTFHRRSYWLLQNPDIVLVHYLNIVDDNSAPLKTLMPVTSPLIDRNDIEKQLDSIYSGIPSECIPKNLGLITSSCTCLSSSTKKSTIAPSQVTLNQITETKTKEENETAVRVQNGLAVGFTSVPFSDVGNQHGSTSTETNAALPHSTNCSSTKTEVVLTNNRNIVSARALVCVPQHSVTRKLIPIAPNVSSNTAIKTNHFSFSSKQVLHSCASSEPQNIALHSNNRPVSQGVPSVSTCSSCIDTENDVVSSLRVSSSSRESSSQVHTTVTRAAALDDPHYVSSSQTGNNCPESCGLSATSLVSKETSQQSGISIDASNVNQTSSVNHPKKDSQGREMPQGQNRSGSEQGHNSMQLHSFPSDKVAVVSQSNCSTNINGQVNSNSPLHSVGEVQTALPCQLPGNRPSSGSYAQPNTINHVVSQEGQSHLKTLPFVNGSIQRPLSFQSNSAPHCCNKNLPVEQQGLLGVPSILQSGCRPFTGDNTFVTYSPVSAHRSQTVHLASNGVVLQNLVSSTSTVCPSTSTVLPSSNVSLSVAGSPFQRFSRSPSLPRQSPDSLSLDLGDLQGLEPFDLDMSDSDINNVLSEYFLSPEYSSSERFPETMGVEDGDNSRNSMSLMGHIELDNQPLNAVSENPSSTRATSTDNNTQVLNGCRDDQLDTHKINSGIASAVVNTTADLQIGRQFDVTSLPLYTVGTFVGNDQRNLYSIAQSTQEPIWPTSIASFSNKNHKESLSVDGQFSVTHSCYTNQTIMHSSGTVNASEVPGHHSRDVAVGTCNQVQSVASGNQIPGNQSNLISNEINMVDTEMKSDRHSARTTSFKIVPTDQLLNVDDTFSVRSDSPRSSGAQVHVEFATNETSLNSVDQLLLQSDSMHDCGTLSSDAHHNGQSVPQSLHSQNNSLQTNSFSNNIASQAMQPQFTSSSVPGSARIIDYSPEWAYPEGGVKVLVTGEWSNHDASYTCLFDGCSVHASLIQSGVLRCFCPPHDPGLVTLQVASNGFIVSNACVFEYHARDSPGGQGSFHEWLAMDEGRFQLAILERVKRLETKLNPTQNMTGSGFSDFSSSQRGENLEERLVITCNSISNCEVVDSCQEAEILYRGMSVLHLAAALGFDKLVQNLLQWRKETTCEIIQQELDPKRKDKFCCTPLMWACALGHTVVVKMLLQCDSDVLVVADARGRLPLQIARDRGYFDVVDAIQQHLSASSSSPKGVLDCDNGQTDWSPVGSLTGASNSSPKSSSLSEDDPGSPLQMTLTDFQEDSETSVIDQGPSVSPLQNTSLTPVSGRQLNTLGKALSHVKALIREAEQEADTDGGQTTSLSPIATVPLSPMQDDPGLITGSSPSWGPAGRLVTTFSSSSPQSSSITPGSSRSSLSPGSPGFLNSPHSSSGATTDTKEFHEFLCSSRKWLEKDFSELTLTDLEQRELYQAAKIIQNAYRSYKIRCQQQEQELQAAILIQNHYRRYKQFALIKKMTKAAKIIQNQYRAYREHEQFKRSRQAAAVIQSYFRNYRQRRQCRRDDYVSKRQEARFLRQSSNRSTAY